MKVGRNLKKTIYKSYRTTAYFNDYNYLDNFRQIISNENIT